MKKKLIVATMLMALVAGASAQNYNASIGGTVGSMYGVTFKGFFLPVDGLGLVADLGVNLFEPVGKGGGWGTAYTFELNPNILYQGEIASWGWGDLAWFAGGGLSLGLLNGIDAPAQACIGKFGVNSLGGAEIALSSVPLAFSADFRPGYGLGFSKNTTASFFDWKVVASVRYIF